MGFDPDAFIGDVPAPGPKRGGFDPDTFLNERDRAIQAAGGDPSIPTIARQSHTPGVVESVGQGIMQGVTFGFADELAGLAAAIDQGKTSSKGGTRFSESRRKQVARQALGEVKRAREANPGAFLGGEIVGSLATAAIPGGAAAKGGFKALAARGAAQGAAAGAGHAEGDIRQRAMAALIAGGAGGLLGAAIPAATAAASKGVRKLVAGAPERIDRRMIRDLVGSANARGRNKLLGPGGVKAPQVAKVIRDEPKLRKALGDPEGMHAAVKEVAEELDDRMAAVYRSVDQVDEGIAVNAVRAVTEKAAKGLEKDFAPELATAVRRTVEKRLELLAGRTTLTATEMRALVSNIQRNAFQGATLNPTLAKQAARSFAMQLREKLNDHVESVAAKHGLELGAIRELNAKRAVLFNLEEVTERAATRQVGPTKVAPFSLDNLERVAKSPVALAASLGAGQPLPVLAARAVPIAARGADKLLAKLGEWMAKQPKLPPRAEIVKKATELGIARVLAERFATAAVR